MLPSAPRLEARVGPGKPTIVEASPDPGSTPEEWISRHCNQLEAALGEHGAILVRGLAIAHLASAARIIRLLVPQLMSELEGFAPRDEYADRIYSSSKWPADRPMCMHHELSYALTVPSRLAMICLNAPDRGGATAVADAQVLLEALPADIVNRFSASDWQLVRNYTGVVGMTWPAAFGTADRTQVERYCAENGIVARWDSDGNLRTRQIRPAVITHPLTGRKCWFNQIAFLNEWTMAEEVREFLKVELGDNGLPFNTVTGAGAPIDPETIDQINDTYAKHALREPWRAGDLLLIDNIRMAHSTEPYEGKRDIVVAMGNPIRRTDCQPA